MAQGHCKREPLDRGAVVLGLLTVALANWSYLAGLARVLDPMLSTDPFYIELAAQPAASILREDPAWGPLYALWLKPFWSLLGDPIAVYRANLYALSIGVTVLVYAYAVLLTRRAAAAVGAALFFLISDLNVPLASKVSGFALLVMLLALGLSELARRRSTAVTIVAAGALLAAYARPELYPAAPVLCAAAFWHARRERRGSGALVLLWPALCLALICAAALALGTPLFSPYHESERAWIAFREHFAWNWTRWNDQSRYFASIWEQEFGGAQTILQALAKNPAAIVRHLADNVLGTLRFMAGPSLRHYPVLAPVTWPSLVSAENFLTAALALGSLAAVGLRAEPRRRFVEQHRHVLLPWTVLAACSFAGAAAIYPVAHYLVLPAVLLALAAILAATLLFPGRPRASRKIGALAALACLAGVPKPFVLPSEYAVPGSPFKARIAVTYPVADTLRFLRSLNLPAPVHLLTVPDGLGEMLGSGFHEVKIWQKGTLPLEQYIRDHDIDLIVTAEPGRVSFVIDDPYWELIQIDPAAAGFTYLSVPNHDVRVYVRNDRLPDGAAP